MSAPRVYAVLPDGVADPSRPSGGNVYDLRVCAALESAGRTVSRILVPGAWPAPSGPDLAGLDAALSSLPDGATVLLDGLVACAAPGVVVPVTARLRTVVLVHLPLADETGLTPGEATRREAGERGVLRASEHVVATSRAIADRLHHRHGLAPDRVHLAVPGVDPAPLTSPSDDGTRLLSVASLTPRKGHDVLVEALAQISDLRWGCAFAGAEPDRGHTAVLHRLVRARGLGHRVEFAGPLSPDELSARYARTDLLVLASRAEPYGMVVAEALSRGIPALVTAVDGLPEALGGDDDRLPAPDLPGMLVPPDDPGALAAALRAWLTDPDVRARRRKAAGTRRASLRTWETTADALAAVLDRQPRTRPTREDQLSQPTNGPGADRFAESWLSLREPADERARSQDLAALAGSALASSMITGSAPVVVHDLGCGTGSMSRWLAPRLSGPQHWVLHDRDPELLARAAALVPRGDDVTVETRRDDVTRLTAADLSGASLVTASALLDLLTDDEVGNLATACARAGCPALFVLSVTGYVELTPADPLDAAVGAAFNGHQRRAVAGRRLLGPDAVDAAAEAFTRLGVPVEIRESPWLLGADAPALTAEWLRGWVGAATEHLATEHLATRNNPSPDTRAYLARRLAEVTDGTLQVTVRHADLFAAVHG